MKPEVKKAYQQAKKTYEAIKTAFNAYKGINGMMRFALDLAILMATREAIKAYDEERAPANTEFFPFLLANISEAIYDASEIALREMNKE